MIQIKNWTFGYLIHKGNSHLYSASDNKNVYLAIDIKKANTFEKKIYQVLQNNKHDNVVCVFDIVSNIANKYAIIEKYTFKSIELAPLFQTNEYEFKRFIQGVCSGLLFLHQKNIIHNDIRLDNIMCKANFSPVLIDFNLSKRKKIGNKEYKDFKKSVGKILYLFSNIIKYRETNCTFYKCDCPLYYKKQLTSDILEKFKSLKINLFYGYWLTNSLEQYFGLFCVSTDIHAFIFCLLQLMNVDLIWSNNVKNSFLYKMLFISTFNTNVCINMMIPKHNIEDYEKYIFSILPIE